MTQVPDVVGPLVGYRAWRVYGDLLCSLNTMMGNPYWAPKHPLRAGCIFYQSINFVAHPSPCEPGVSMDHALTPGCGIYAYKTIKNLERGRGGDFSMGPDLVFGMVELWGRFYEHERGYRAEYARPIALYKSTYPGYTGYEVDRVAKMYEIPVLDYPTKEQP